MTDKSDLLTVELGPWTVMQDPNVDSFVNVSHDDRSGIATLEKELDDRDELCFDSTLIDAISELKNREDAVGRSVLMFEDNNDDRLLLWPEGDWCIYPDGDCELRGGLECGDRLLLYDESHMVAPETGTVGGDANYYLSEPEHNWSWEFESVDVVEVTEEMVSA